jgi:hypothetical protein
MWINIHFGHNKVAAERLVANSGAVLRSTH